MDIGILQNVSEAYRTSSVPPVTLDDQVADNLLQELIFDEFFPDIEQKSDFLAKFVEIDTSKVNPEAVDLASQNRAPSVQKSVPVVKSTTDEPALKKAKTNDGDVRRRILNRINAKNSRIRNKFKVEGLIQKVQQLQRENEELKRKIEAKSQGVKDEEVQKPENDKTVEVSAEDYSLLECLLRSKSNFCVTDPHQPDNPIINASPGFYEMTGYGPKEVLGKNCRFLQGPGTKPETVSTIRTAMEKGESVAVTMLNYRKDGTHFWNQLYISPIMGPDGKSIVHFIGVQREIIVKNLPDSVLKGAKTKFAKQHKK